MGGDSCGLAVSPIRDMLDSLWPGPDGEGLLGCIARPLSSIQLSALKDGYLRGDLVGGQRGSYRAWPRSDWQARAGWHQHGGWAEWISQGRVCLARWG